MGSSQHARTLSRRCVESDPRVCRERPKGKEKSASLQGYVEVETFGRGVRCCVLSEAAPAGRC